jgi:hypothetical protein
LWHSHDGTSDAEKEIKDMIELRELTKHFWEKEYPEDKCPKQLYDRLIKNIWLLDWFAINLGKNFSQYWYVASWGSNKAEKTQSNITYIGGSGFIEDRVGKPSSKNSLNLYSWKIMQRANWWEKLGEVSNRST